MKLQSKVIFPVEARDKLVERLGNVDNGISDMRLALETAEQQCFELKKENEALAQVYLDLNHATNKELEEVNKQCFDLNKEKTDCLERIIRAIGQLKWGHLKNKPHDKLTSDEQIANSIYDVVIALIETQIK